MEKLGAFLAICLVLIAIVNIGTVFKTAIEFGGVVILFYAASCLLGGIVFLLNAIGLKNPDI